jgi:glycosyltransferase involved in cell wall biosynthesis
MSKITCPDCQASAPIADDDVAHVVLLEHRKGCPFGLTLLEAEALGKPVAAVVAGRLVRLVTAIAERRPS